MTRQWLHRGRLSPVAASSRAPARAREPDRVRR